MQGNPAQTMGQVWRQQLEIRLVQPLNQSVKQAGRVPETMHQHEGSGHSADVPP